MVEETHVLIPVEPQRPDTLQSGDERDLLNSWLDWHRTTLLRKCAGLTVAQLRTPAAEPSTLTLLGLLRHMAEVEDWFHGLGGRDVVPPFSSEADPYADFEGAATSDPVEDLAIFKRRVAQSREIAAQYGLDVLQPGSRGRQLSLRWVYLHMIEEYARHNGHADLLRERIDGATGD